MKKLSTFLLFSFLFLSLFSQERQIAFFPESKVFTIDKKLASKSNLFANYIGFENAMLFEITPLTFVLEISYKINGSLFKKRLMMNVEEKNNFINDLSVQLKTSNKSFDINQSGRSAFLIGSTVTSLGYYSHAVPTMLDIEPGKSFIAMYMLTAGAGFVLPYVLTKDIEITRPQASMSFYGQSRGIGHGLMLTYIIDTEADIRAAEAVSTLFSVGEGLAGFHLAKKWDYSRGDASIFQLGGDIGVGYGFLFADVFGFYDYNENFNGRRILTSGLVGNAIGLVGGKYLADTRNYTLGDAIVLRENIGLGILVSNSIVDYFVSDDNDEITPYTVATIAGTAAGGALGMYLLQGKDFSVNQGIMIGLGEIAGGLIGLGTGYLIADEDNMAPYLLTFSSIGAAAGYALLFNNYAKKIELNETQNLSLNLSINPAGFMGFTDYKFRNGYIPNLAGIHIQF